MSNWPSRRLLSRLVAWTRHSRRTKTGGLIAIKGPSRDAPRWNQNVGPEVGEWSERARRAVELLTASRPATDSAVHVADFGCGRQTLRALLPATWTYTPFDYMRRSVDTVIWDLNRGCPDGTFDVIFLLGVLEYLQDPIGLLAQVVPNCHYLVFSYHGPTDPARRRRQGWISHLTFELIEKVLAEAGAALSGVKDLEKGERLYAFRGTLVADVSAGGAS